MARIVSAETGGDTVVYATGGSPVTLIDIATTMGLAAHDYTEPDLFLWCDAPINTGVLLFCPVGEFRFSSAPQAIHIFDKYGTNQVGLNIEIGAASITPRGDVALEIDEVGPNLPAFGVILRGVQVDMNGDADENSVHGYTVGGTAVHQLMASISAIADGTDVLDNWQTLQLEPDYNWGEVSASIVGSSDPATLGSPITMVVSGSDTNTGYHPGIVIEGSASNAIGNGSIVLRGVAGFQFVMDEDTKVYLVDADTGSNLYHAELSASVDVSEYGDLKVTLDNIESFFTEERVAVLITGAKVSYTAPVPAAGAYELVTFGSAVRSPLPVTRPFIEADNEASPQAGPLPQAPVEVSGWTPVAVGG
jgi:hypothetical protein